jgi:drug/metabolite transporter (DMT)-like permease
MSLLTLVFVIYALRAIANIDPDRRSAETDELLFGLTPQTANNVTAVTAGLIFAMSALTIVMAIGILRRREASRYAAIFVFSIVGAIVFAGSLEGVLADPPMPNAVYGVACGVANAAIVGLLLAPATADDFSEAEHERKRARDRRRESLPSWRS